VPTSDANLKRMREIMRKLDEVSRTAQELRERVMREMAAAHDRESPATDDAEVTKARKAAKQR
jgi:hypothetical protein